ncbi:DUF3306 domain-containing protein [Bradyrhizobium sp. CB82]|uniref:DUF3306 domain-containing protein n=1 Tax=Bradyrhizobium sp. CB82 TaxID=3039159 RepID=UPI0024B17500|nr:DUF3306 domain-containing protein [Bradyrhizobium sp. CB82]WFU45067.1 DUF3306 domain-containing protein [Bradyrhizobium sp. CB82]
MDEDKFLARWSRRKQAAKANAAPPATAIHEDVQSAPPPATSDDQAEFDLSSLPSIDTITSATDIKAFLRRGIPPELTRAALRRAWSADPAIREFVGLAENAWDFNDPNAMPGFGPLDCSNEQLAALIDRIVGVVREAAQTLPERSVEPEDSSAEPVANAAEPAVIESAPVAAQPAVTEEREHEAAPVRRRTHGGALPI